MFGNPRVCGWIDAAVPISWGQLNGLQPIPNKGAHAIVPAGTWDKTYGNSKTLLPLSLLSLKYFLIIHEEWRHFEVSVVYHEDNDTYNPYSVFNQTIQTTYSFAATEGMYPVIFNQSMWCMHALICV